MIVNFWPRIAGAKSSRQFLSPFSNQRADTYGGSVENRLRFVIEVAKEISTAIGKDRTAIRLFPYGAFNGMPAYPEIEAAYTRTRTREPKQTLSLVPQT